MNTTPIQKAIGAAGGQASLARAIKVKSQVVWQWADGRRPVPAHHCLAIEQASGGEVSRYDLRPDVFGDAPKAGRRAA